MGQKWRTCPYLGKLFLAVTKPCWANCAEIFEGAQGTIIYRLVMRNQDYEAYFQFSIFRPLLTGKWAWPTG